MRALGIILAFAAALWSGRLQAQHYIGVRGGWGGGSVRFQPVRETGIHWGLYSGGLSYKFYTEQKYVGAIQVDLEYMQRGFMYDEVRGGDTSYHRTINTFELPFMWQPHIYVFQRHARVYLNLGVYLSYATGSKYYWQSKKNGIFEQGDYPMMLTRDPRWAVRSGIRGALLPRLLGRAAQRDQIYRQSEPLALGQYQPVAGGILPSGQGRHTLGAEQGRRPAYAGGRSAAGSKKARARNGPAGDGYASSGSFRPGRQRFSRALSSGRSSRFRSRKITIKTDLK